MKTYVLPILFLFSAQAMAFTQLTCKVSETVHSTGKSIDFTVNAPLNGPSMAARIDLVSENFPLHYGFETFLSQVTSPGQQVILIGVRNDKTATGFGADGHGFAALDYDLENGYLNIQCTLQ